jgi:hypothetical protein
MSVQTEHQEFSGSEQADQAWLFAFDHGQLPDYLNDAAKLDVFAGMIKNQSLEPDFVRVHLEGFELHSTVPAIFAGPTEGLIQSLFELVGSFHEFKASYRLNDSLPLREARLVRLDALGKTQPEDAWCAMQPIEKTELETAMVSVKKLFVAQQTRSAPKLET